MIEKKILNLGAGNDIIRGAVNHDRIKHRNEISSVWDLNVLPWPFGDGEFDIVNARAVLEHLNIDLIKSVNEVWRILKPGGILVLKLPHWNHNISYIDPTHRWFYSIETPTIFDPSTEYGSRYNFYTDRKWKIVKGPKLKRAKSSIHCTLKVMK